MKAFLQALAVLIIAAVTAAGAYFFLEREYAKRLELDESNKTLTALQLELGELKQTLLRQQIEGQSRLNETNEKITLLQNDVKELKNVLNNVFASQEKTTKTFASLQEEIKELKNTYLSKAELASVLKTEVRSLSADYHPIDIDLGPLPSGKPKDLTYKIPDSVPDSAGEILVYAYVATNYVRGGAHHFKISVKVDEAREATFYLYAIANTQQEWSYNSDNTWLPMPKDRELHLAASGDNLFGKWESGVKVVAYR